MKSRVMTFPLLALLASGSAPPPSPSDAPIPNGNVNANADAQAHPNADAELRAHADDVVDYTLSASLDVVAHTIKGKGTIRFRNTSSETLHELWLHLYLNAFKNADSRFLREPVGTFRGGGGVRDWGFVDVTKFVIRGKDVWRSAETHFGNDADETEARVPLEDALPPGGAMTIDVEFTSKLPSVVERTGYDGSYHFAGQWFPKIAKLEPNGQFARFAFTHLSEFYADFGTYDVTVDVPAGFLIGATGRATETRDENGRHIERHVESDIHDFAFTAWDQFEKRERRVGNVDVTILSPRGTASDAARELDSVSFALPYFNAKYGAYPYGELTLVHPPETADETGGMEYPTLITTGRGPYFLPSGIHALEAVTVHELGHEWFYGLVATNENKYPFLDEGINSYAEADALDRYLGPGSIADVFDLTLSDKSAHAVLGRPPVHDDNVNSPSDEFATGFDYGRLVYDRTSSILETMRRTWGEEKTDEAIGAYARDFRFQHPTPEDFLKEIETHVGPEARAFVDRSVNARGWVDFAVLAAESAPEESAAGIFDKNGARDTVAHGTGRTGKYRGTALISRRGTLDLPVEIELIDENGGKRRVKWDGHGSNFRVQYQGDAALAFVVVDPDHAVLVDQNYLNNHMATSEAKKPGAPRTFERAFFWAQTLLWEATP